MERSGGRVVRSGLTATTMADQVRHFRSSQNSTGETSARQTGVSQNRIPWKRNALACLMVTALGGCAAVHEELGNPQTTSSELQASGPHAAWTARTVESQPSSASAPAPDAPRMGMGMGTKSPAASPTHSAQIAEHVVKAGPMAAPISAPPLVKTSADAPMDTTPTHANNDAHSTGHGATAASSGGAVHVHWSYEGEGGPANWASLSPEYQICKTGRNQSPINIPSGLMVQPGMIQFDYAPVPLAVLNNGHTIQVQNSSRSSIQVEGDSYALAQFHFHSPSEHTVGGRSYPLEMHLVHKNEAGKLAVVGLLFENGPDNPILQSIWQSVPPAVNQLNTVAGVSLDISSMLSLDRGYVRYGGSLTTPPCTEGVSWFVLNQTHYVSEAQTAAFRETIGPNNRPVQFLMGRKIYRNQ